MEELRQFNMYYYSELSAVISLSYDAEQDMYIVSATHTTDAVGILDWFHFVDEDVTAEKLVYNSPDSFTALAKMADKLSTGPVPVLDNYDIPDPRRQFFTDFMTAMYTREYNVSHGRRTDYISDAGDNLMERAQRLK
jgi:hypothetical protein